MTENLFLRSPYRDTILGMLVTAPLEGVPISAIIAIEGIGSRDAVDHLLLRMLRDGEVERVGRGRYGPLRPRRSVPRDPTPETKPEAPIPPAPNGANGSHQHQAPKPAAPKPQGLLASDPGVSLRDELARELIERRLGIEEDQPVVDSAPRPTFCFETFVATIGGKYVRAGLCSPSPLRLRSLASGWLASGIAPEHCLAVIDRFLREHAPGRRSGSLDGLLPYLDKLIRRNGAPQPRRQEPRSRNSLDEYTTRSRAKRITEADWLGDY